MTNPYGEGHAAEKIRQVLVSTPLGERLFQKQKFNLQGCRRILDVGSGRGDLAAYLVERSTAFSLVIGIDALTSGPPGDAASPAPAVAEAVVATPTTVAAPAIATPAAAAAAPLLPGSKPRMSSAKAVAVA